MVNISNVCFLENIFKEGANFKLEIIQTLTHFGIDKIVFGYYNFTVFIAITGSEILFFFSN